MATRVFYHRETGVDATEFLSLIPTTGSEVACRVIINNILIKCKFNVNSWSRMWGNLLIIPGGSLPGSTILTPNVPNSSDPYAGYDLLPVASFSIHSTSNAEFKFDENISLRGGSNSYFYVGGAGAEYIQENVSDYMGQETANASGGLTFPAGQPILSGNGFLKTGDKIYRWHVPEYFYMKPDDKLYWIVGAATYASPSSEIYSDNTTYFRGTDFDLVCIAESN